MYSAGCIWMLLIAVGCASVGLTQAYSALQDARIIAEYRRQLGLNHTKIARELVHRANWAAVGSISTNDVVNGYPMVNIISIDDNNLKGKSSGIIRFMLTDLDFTGPDWQNDNKVTFMFTDEQTLNCKNTNKDPMEPTCARVIISGQVIKVPENSPSFKQEQAIFINRHPAAANWIKVHAFYLCELDIQNIFVLDFYGGPHKVSASDYYAINI
ncbi:protein CREG1 [Drosophila grimshawi]|uniref:GH17497 n=1 Tax=Drosophila grimshawi TaxID=7222 RepID=B4JTW0_DROGR|nr:protein CREG1 [Drosophila grimshawi]XP_032596405.1 protein CREG1 [Drosophila grimshawi]XP_043070923.1 protein CREG1 [Drosophila grimshawi]EDV91539.1 GH17497 [Drosophila grimshawi]